MKKAIVIFCFLLISVFSTGSFFVYTFYLKSYKKEFKAFLKNNQFPKTTTLIQINPSELYTNSTRIVWEDCNQEVLYKGELYDVISIHNNGLSISLSLVSDSQEMLLKQQFAVLFDADSSHSTKVPFQILKSLMALKYIVDSYKVNLKPQELSLSLVSFSLILKTNKGYFTKHSPPPDVFCNCLT